MFTEIARLTNNLCPVDLLGDPDLSKNVCGHFFCSPWVSVVWRVWVFLLKLHLAVKEKKFGFHF